MKEVLYTISGKRLPAVFHIAARALTSHSLNVHAGHDDVMGCVDVGWGMLFAKNVQDAGDLALGSRGGPVRRALPDSGGYRCGSRLQLRRAGAAGAQRRSLRRLHGLRDQLPGHGHPGKAMPREVLEEHLGGIDDEDTREYSRELFTETTKYYTSFEKRRAKKPSSPRGRCSASSSTRPSARAAASASRRAAITTRSG
jgi:hypothetical protein